MRIFEIAMTGLLAVGAVLSLANGNRGRTLLWALFGLDLTALLFHLRMEGAHWQMAPGYLGAAFFAGLLIIPVSQGNLARAGAGIMLALALLAICLSALLPMFRLPRPTGSMAVGTQVIYLADDSRPAGPEGSGKREIMIQIWYPAAASRQPFAPYRRREETTRLSSYQSLLPTHSRWNAPVSKEGDAYPVLLFNPAWNGRRTQNTFLVEELASHGFVVVGIDHTYNSEPVAFPDGRVVRAAHGERLNFDSDSLETIRAEADKELLRQTADDIFVLNHLQAINSDATSDFYGRLNTQDAGALGHSFGGAVAAQACADDPRIRAALDIDGSLFGEVQRTGLSKPFLFMTGDPAHYPAEDTGLNHAQLIDKALDAGDTSAFAKFGGYRIIIHGATHFSFTDKTLFSSSALLSTGASISSHCQIRIVRAYSLAFFEQALMGKKSDLLKPGANPYREAKFEAVGQALHSQ